MKVKLGEICEKASSNIAQKDIENNIGQYPIYGASGLIRHVDFYHQEQPCAAVVKDGAGVGRVFRLPAKSSVIGTLQYIIPKPGIDVNYLCYALESMNLARFYTGATIPHIYFKDYCNTMLQSHTFAEQRIIGATLDKTCGIIEYRKQQLQKVDELVKARFVEMFGTPGIWQELPLSEVCKQVKRYPTFCNMEYIEDGVRVIRIGNILEDGHMDENDANYVFVYADANKDYPDTVIEKNDIVMAVRGDGSTAKRIGIVTEDILIGANISPNLIRIQANGDIVLPRFLFYFLTSKIGQQRLEKYVNKTAKKNIAAKDIIKVMLPVPPMNVQEQFSNFIAQVDKSKSSIQSSLDQFETLKQSLMQKYFG